MLGLGRNECRSGSRGFVEASFFETLVEFTNRFSFSSFRVSFQQYAKTFSKKWNRMRSRHAAALALLGWYLIEPPPLLDPWWSQYWPWSTAHRWDGAAPLSRWPIRDTFETLKKCQDDLATTQRENAEYVASSIEAWQCVASDDRRLKTN
jgi:hypothetical protein